MRRISRLLLQAQRKSGQLAGRHARRDGADAAGVVGDRKPRRGRGDTAARRAGGRRGARGARCPRARRRERPGADPAVAGPHRRALPRGIARLECRPGGQQRARGGTRGVRLLSVAERSQQAAGADTFLTQLSATVSTRALESTAPVPNSSPVSPTSERIGRFLHVVIEPRSYLNALYLLTAFPLVLTYFLALGCAPIPAPFTSPTRLA